jgi:hypothetical protein
MDRRLRAAQAKQRTQERRRDRNKKLQWNQERIGAQDVIPLTREQRIRRTRRQQQDFQRRKIQQHGRRLAKHVPFAYKAWLLETKQKPSENMTSYEAAKLWANLLNRVHRMSTWRGGWYVVCYGDQTIGKVILNPFVCYEEVVWNEREFEYKPDFCVCLPRPGELHFDVKEYPDDSDEEAEEESKSKSKSDEPDEESEEDLSDDDNFNQGNVSQNGYLCCKECSVHLGR